MKKAFLFAACLLFTWQLNAQSTGDNKGFYLHKSKSQKTAAFILLGGGAALGLTGLLIGNQQESTLDQVGTAALIGGTGLLAMIGSIPLFIASHRNKDKAVSIQASAYNRADGIISRKIPFQIGLALRL